MCYRLFLFLTLKLLYQQIKGKGKKAFNEGVIEGSERGKKKRKKKTENLNSSHQQKRTSASSKDIPAAVPSLQMLLCYHSNSVCNKNGPNILVFAPNKLIFIAMNIDHLSTVTLLPSVNSQFFSFTFSHTQIQA